MQHCAVNTVQAILLNDCITLDYTEEKEADCKEATMKKRLHVSLLQS